MVLRRQPHPPRPNDLPLVVDPPAENCNVDPLKFYHILAPKAPKLLVFGANGGHPGPFFRVPGLNLQVKRPIKLPGTIFRGFGTLYIP